MKRLLAMLVAAGLATGAAAQLRSVPDDARRAQMRHLQDLLIELDGRPALLSPGAQIRDAANRLVLPASIMQSTVVKYLTDASGMVHRVWILSPQEAAQSAPPPRPAPKPAPEGEGKKSE